MNINPDLAVTLADAVYGIRTNSDVRVGVSSALPGLPMPGYHGPLGRHAAHLMDSFDVSGAAITGRSGDRLRSATSGFAMVLKGRGRYRGQVALVCRGTESFNDWSTNAKCTIENGPHGIPVHAGFNRVFQSMKESVTDTLKSIGTIDHLHVVGHSLGGAIATLFACHFCISHPNISLYTFGQPRTGAWLQDYDEFMKVFVGYNRIHRVYALADPVPMIPIWPFYHPSCGEYKIDTGGQGISFAAHKMGNYRLGVAQKTWTQLATQSKQIKDHKSVDYWIGRLQENAVSPFSSIGFWLLGKALSAILKLAEATLGTAIVLTCHAADRIALILRKAMGFVAGLAEQLEAFVEAAMWWLGQTAYKAGQGIVHALRYVLNLLIDHLYQQARRAVNPLP